MIIIEDLKSYEVAEDPTCEAEFIQYRRLTSAIILQAIKDWQHYANSKDPTLKAISDEAYKWLFVDKSNKFLSFAWYLSFLGINADRSRTILEKMYGNNTGVYKSAEHKGEEFTQC